MTQPERQVYVGATRVDQNADIWIKNGPTDSKKMPSLKAMAEKIKELKEVLKLRETTPDPEFSEGHWRTKAIDLKAELDIAGARISEHWSTIKALEEQVEVCKEVNTKMVDELRDARMKAGEAEAKYDRLSKDFQAIHVRNNQLAQENLEQANSLEISGREMDDMALEMSALNRTIDEKNSHIDTLCGLANSGNESGTVTLGGVEFTYERIYRRSQAQ